jgi:hypothetical protein
MELGGKGSFQTAKLQRSARTTVCSHSARDMAAMRSIKSQQEHTHIYNEFLSGCGHLGMGLAFRDAKRDFCHCHAEMTARGATKTDPKREPG